MTESRRRLPAALAGALAVLACLLPPPPALAAQARGAGSAAGSAAEAAPALRVVDVDAGSGADVSLTVAVSGMPLTERPAFSVSPRELAEPVRVRRIDPREYDLGLVIAARDDAEAENGRRIAADLLLALPPQARVTVGRADAPSGDPAAAVLALRDVPVGVPEALEQLNPLIERQAAGPEPRDWLVVITAAELPVDAMDAAAAAGVRVVPVGISGDPLGAGRRVVDGVVGQYAVDVRMATPDATRLVVSLNAGDRSASATVDVPGQAERSGAGRVEGPGTGSGPGRRWGLAGAAVLLVAAAGVAGVAGRRAWRARRRQTGRASAPAR